MTAVVNLGPLPRSSAEELAISAAQGGLLGQAAERWARWGRFVPLGIVEALAEALASGELREMETLPNGRSWVDVGSERSPREWVLRRLGFVRSSAKPVLYAVAVLGVEVAASLVHELGRAMGALGAFDHFDALRRERWLGEGPEGFYVLPSRTHREVIVSAMPQDERVRWHGAAARVIEGFGGRLACAEAARHAALAGDPKRAVELALMAAEASQRVELASATEALLAFAGASADDIAPKEVRARDFRLMSWVDSFRPGDRDEVAIRLRAISSLAKGATWEALAALREGMQTAENALPRVRSRASLAYGIALAVAGRHNEVLFAALEALARARESGEPAGVRACARFLARLSLAAGHPEASTEWQRVAGEGS